MNSIRIVVVAGPTGSGKSKLALSVAETLGGEIIGLDSVQIYRGADIGSAKPATADRNRVKHHLIDIVDPDVRFSVKDFVDRADQWIADLSDRETVPVVVGGNTMYLTALLHGLVEAPEVSPALREELARTDVSLLYEELSQLDPVAAERLHRNDRTRIVRALETVRSTGASLASLQSDHSYRGTRYRADMLVVVHHRSQLYARIDQRSAEMVANGLLEESRRLFDRWGPDIPLWRSIGYSEALACLQGTLEAGALVGEIAKNTRRYAKRQLTYWRNEPAKRGWEVCAGGELVESRSVGGRRQLDIVGAHFHPEEVLSSDLCDKPRVWFYDPAI